MRWILGWAGVAGLAVTVAAEAAWPAGSRFRVEQADGRPCMVDPAGKPFKSVGMVWAYGPEQGPMAHRVDLEKLHRHLQLIKDLGFNTLNLYGDQLIPEMLAWCDEHELAVYFRTWYNNVPGLEGEAREYPDLMDPEFRRASHRSFARLADQVRGHPSVLAIDIDNRWLFPLDWAGAVRIAEPKLGPHGVAGLPRWLEGEYGGDIARLNAAWGTAYAGFSAVTGDERIVRGGRVVKLGDDPWRGDLVRYTIWTQNDFWRDLARRLREATGGVLVTPTTEHPECLPDVQPSPADGVAFMSPVHYNQEPDYDRDLPALAKLIYETRWHYDLQGGPVYISETGWRTDTLEQQPPVTSYAWLVPPDEETAARVYAVQMSLLQVLPWIGGFGYFKLYDKVPEGDFGYLRDSGEKKPQAYVGDAINGVFSAPGLPDPEPQAWIYYPDYALASHRPGFQQFKTFVLAWEHAFITSLYARVDGNWDRLRAGDREAGMAFAAAVASDFRAQWRGFAFTRTIPADDKPVLLFSTVSEILSAEDRVKLLGKRTLCFGEVGTRDTAMRPTPRWNEVALNVAEGARDEGRVAVDLGTGAEMRSRSFWSWLPWWKEPEFSWERAWSGPVVCSGQALPLPAGSYKRLELVAGSARGDAAAFCEVEYEDGTRQRAVLGPSITDKRFEPLMTAGIEADGAHYSRIDIPLEPQRAVRAVHLPDDRRIELRGAALVKGGVASGVVVRVVGRDGSAEGRVPWLLALDDARRVEVLQRFENGEPAVVAYGRHVSFLYDAMTWAGKPDEFSRNVGAIRETVDLALEHLEGR